MSDRTVDVAVRDATTVLVVDDDSPFAELTATFLERVSQEFTVETATSTVEGLDCLANRDVDCVVSDYDMPKMNGLEFLTAVREEYPTLPFILFTGKGSEEIANEAISTGVTDYLQKRTGSEQFELLANQIGNAVERARAKRELEQSEDLLEKTQRMASVGGWEYDLCTDEVRWTDEVNQIHELPPEFEPDLQSVLDFYHPEDAPGLEDAIQRAVNHGESYDLELRLNTANDDRRWVRALGESHQEGGETVMLRGTIQDITDRKVREQEIEEQQAKMKALHAFATDLQFCRTKDEVYELTVDAAERILNLYLCYVGITEDDSIVPKACSAHAGPEYVQTMAADEGIAGKTLQTGTSYLIEDVAAVDEAKPAREDYHSAISVPLGDIGVFQAISKEVGRFDESDLELVEIFLAHVVATLKNV